MKKLVFLALLLFAFTANVPAQISPALQARLQFVLDSVCSLYNIKGASAAVLMPQQGTWTGAYGESHAGVPITTDMYFGIGSNTKTFTSALMLKLQENGLLSLDDTIGTWIQGVNYVNGQITIRQLLNHTSGLYNFTSHPNFGPSVNADVTAIWQPEDVLQFIDDTLFAPGTDWSYSNTNYLLAGLIIKEVLGTSYQQALRDSILSPQGLANTVYYPFETPSGTIPHAWSRYFGPPYLVDGTTIGWEHTANFSMAGTAGAIMSTAEDNVKFWDKLMSENIINSASLQEMTQMIPIGAGIGYGLGIFRRASFNGHPVYTHGGTNVCFINENIYDEINGTCISVLTNQDSVLNNIILTKVIAALHKETLGPLSIAGANQNGPAIIVYPNPAGRYVNVSTASDGQTIHIADMMGREMLSRQLHKGVSEVPLQDCPRGFYLIQLTDKSGATVYTEKLTVN